MEKRSARDYFPRACGDACGLDDLRAAARGCEGCERFRCATQTVFGEGDPHARLMLVGEVPGDDEDVAGEPFVGPAGKLLDDVLAEAGVERRSVWLTNAVKHFGYEQRGARRIHQKPTWGQVMACRPWLDAEIDLVDPDFIVLLGATAAQSLLGRDFRITHHRGERLAAGGRRLLPTWHPSAVLRAPEREDRHRMRGELAADVRGAAKPLRASR